MSAAVQTVEMQASAVRTRVDLAFLLALLALRVSLITGVETVTGALPDWANVTYQVATYLLTVGFILFERDRLADFHIDALAIWIILFFKPLETIIYRLLYYDTTHSPLAFPEAPALLIWGAAFFLIAALRISGFLWPKIEKRNFLWLLWGAAAGIGLAILLAYPMSFRYTAVERTLIPSVWRDGLVNIPYQVGYAAVSEEPLFRGILWGYLRHAGWKNLWIWLVQAGLFALSHLYYLSDRPFFFWVSVPLGGLVLGLLAWRSRSIATSMAAHGFVNGLGWTFAYLAAILRSF
ncbi:MAG TPA: CPBP family intramembrane glutamic endopeptidase [Anaerolineaceae bacterium]|nr:CPBP family intramembrane glutamic endopeptidase [Anaerolineaceae bacterium]